MSKLVKTVLIAVALAAVGLPGASAAYSLAFKEIDELNDSLKKSTKLLKSKQLELRRAQLVAAKFQSRLKESLPREPDRALVKYQEFLVRLSQACELTSIVVSSAQPEKIEGLGYALSFSIQARGGTDQLGEFITRFYDNSVLHRFTHIDIFQSSSPDSPSHSFSADTSVLILDSVPEKMDSVPLRTNSQEHRDIFAARDIFRRPTIPTPPSPEGVTEVLVDVFTEPSSPDEPTVEVPGDMQIESGPQLEPDPPDRRDYVRFIGMVIQNDSQLAVFCNLMSGETQTLGKDQTLQDLGIDSKIIDIRGSTVWFKEDQQIRELSLGAFYKDAAPAD